MNIQTQVVEARNSGKTYTEIYQEFGVAKSTAQDWVRKSQTSGYPTVTPYINHNLNRDGKQKFRRTEEEVLDFLEQLAPINLPGLKASVPEVERSSYAVVCSDLHFPLQCEKSVAILFETIRRLNPSTIIINGDSCDILALSRFPKDIVKGYDLLTERVAYQKFLHELISISNGATIYETNANHSSGGVESRLRRYLNERIPELAKLPEVVDMLSYENLFLGPYREYVQLVDYVDLNGLYVMHGTTVRKNPGSSVLGEMERFRASIMMGHVHRMGCVSLRQPSIGAREEHQLRGYEIGCMCDLNPIYASSPNWTNGFAIVALGEDTFGVELVSIINGAATISTLGATIVA